MATYPYNGWLAVVSDEPIPGLPSHRTYGPFPSREHAMLAITERGLHEVPHLTTGVLPLRQPAQMEQER